MTNKENIDQLTDYIDKLKKLTENIYEKEIYPVSFFSLAFDITNKIQDSLHQIEKTQIELFEKQMKEHQAQIRKIQRIEKTHEPIQTTPAIDEELPMPPPLADHPRAALLQTEPHIEEIKTITEDDKNKKKTLPDLKKAFTLNDRFRFCRELFSSNESLMNLTFSELNKIESYKDSIAYIKEHLNWDLKEEVAIEFISMIEKRFN